MASNPRNSNSNTLQQSAITFLRGGVNLDCLDKGSGSNSFVRGRSQLSIDSLSRNTGIQGYRNPRVQEYWNTGIQEYRNTGLQEYRNTGIQEYRNTGIQEYRNTEIQEYRNTGIQTPVNYGTCIPAGSGLLVAISGLSSWVVACTRTIQFASVQCAICVTYKLAYCLFTAR